MLSTAHNFFIYSGYVRWSDVILILVYFHCTWDLAMAILILWISSAYKSIDHFFKRKGFFHIYQENDITKVALLINYFIIFPN